MDPCMDLSTLVGGRLVNWQNQHEEKTAALATTYLDDVPVHLDVDAADDSSMKM